TSSQINLELYASYVYLSMTYYFDGTTSHCTTLPSFSLIIQTRRTSMQRSSLQNQRGGRIFLQDHKLYWVTKPACFQSQHNKIKVIYNKGKMKNGVKLREKHLQHKFEQTP
uniref:Uncharacterized protein n=1 Tax=Mola mola TaxID=94237 RepID=A0A3Q3VX45_MOLML